MDNVTAILVDRSREPEGLRKMLLISLGVHLVLSVLVLFMPAPSIEDEAPPEVMQISLGGAPGPVSGGMTPMGGRPTEAAPPEVLERAPVIAPPAQAPEMVLPKPVVQPPKPKPAPKPEPRTAPQAARPRPTPKAAETKDGNAVAETGGEGVKFGLTTGGGQTGGYLDVGDFCCPEYLSTMLQLIQRNWSSKQQVPGETVMKFTIQRDGTLSNVELERSSGYFALDQTAQRALLLTRQLPPLPSQYTEPDLTVHLIFRYER